MSCSCQEEDPVKSRPKGARAGLLTIAIAIALALAACSPASTQVSVATRVAITITPQVDTLPFDPRSARITAAAELAEIAGHYVALDVDAAIVPEFRSSFEEALGQAFENMARDLADLRKRAPRVFAYGAPLLEHVRVRYDAAKTRDEITFDVASRTLSILGPAKRDALVPEHTLARALGDAYRTHAERRFREATPDSIPANERRAYFEYLTGSGYAKSSEKDVAGLASSPRATQILAVLRLYELADFDRALASDATKWLSSEFSWFVQQYVHNGALVRQLPADCIFRRAESAYARWMLAAYRTADDDKQLAIERAIFVRSFSQERVEQGKSYPPFAWPTIDRFAFGLSIVDAWRSEGHPTAISARRVSRAQDFIVCPEATQGDSRIGSRCDHDWYRFALETAEGRTRLAAALVERNDPKFAEAAFTALPRAVDKPVDTTIAMLRAVEKSPVVWRAAMRAFLERADNEQDTAILEEAQRLWLERAEYRGVLLYLLARIDRYDNGNVDWRGFEDAFGGKVSRAELEAFVAEGPIALALLPTVWPALAKDYSRAEIIVPKLDAMLEDPSVRRAPKGGSAYTALSNIIGRLCVEKNVADLAALRTYLRDRVQRHPGEAYARLADEATSDRCKPPPPSPPPRNEVRLVSGKERLRIFQDGKRKAGGQR